jgi:lauroyl/myristoyl acyltransferase
MTIPASSSTNAAVSAPKRHGPRSFLSRHPRVRRVVYAGYGLLFVPLVIGLLPLYLVPRPWLYALARLIGVRLLYPFVRERINKNLYYAYGERMTSHRANVLGREVVVNVASAVLDCGYLWGHWWHYPFRKNVATVINRAAVDVALQDGHGLIVATAHYGCFEIMPAFFISTLGVHGGVIARAFPAPLLNWMYYRARMLHDCETFFDDVKGALRTLHMNGVIGILPDLRAKKRLGRPANFYGKPTLTFDIHVRLAAHARCPIIPAFLLRHRRRPWEYTLLICDPIDVPRKPDEETIGLLVQQLNDVFEYHIRRSPCGWIWLHNKWNLW